VAIAAGSGEAVHGAILEAARSGEPDRYLAALLAPAARRADLLALAAFSAELARIPYAARREPAMAAIRLRWWHDALALPQQASSGHPIADALRAASVRHGLAHAVLAGLIEARARDLEPCPFADDADLDRYLLATEGALFALAAQILGAGPAWHSAQAGQAYGLARLLVGLPVALARRHLPIPLARLAAQGAAAEDLFAAARPDLLVPLVAGLGQRARASLERARRDVTKLPREQLIAVLPLALVESYVRASARASRRARQGVAPVAPLTRLVRIAAARWFGRL